MSCQVTTRNWAIGIIPDASTSTILPVILPVLCISLSHLTVTSKVTSSLLSVIAGRSRELNELLNAERLLIIVIDTMTLWTKKNGGFRSPLFSRAIFSESSASAMKTHPGWPAGVLRYRVNVDLYLSHNTDRASRGSRFERGEGEGGGGKGGKEEGAFFLDR